MIDIEINIKKILSTRHYSSPKIKIKFFNARAALVLGKALPLYCIDYYIPLY